MARRQRLPSWVEDEPKAPKPVEPLRYRISPNEKKLDQLDQLEAELSRTALEWDEWEYLQKIIDTKREKLAKAREKELGEEKPKPMVSNASGRPCKAPRMHSKRVPVHSHPFITTGAKWLLCTLLAAVILF